MVDDLQADTSLVEVDDTDVSDVLSELGLWISRLTDDEWARIDAIISDAKLHAELTASSMTWIAGDIQRRMRGKFNALSLLFSLHSSRFRSGWEDVLPEESKAQLNALIRKHSTFLSRVARVALEGPDDWVDIDDQVIVLRAGDVSETRLRLSIRKRNGEVVLLESAPDSMLRLIRSMTRILARPMSDLVQELEDDERAFLEHVAAHPYVNALEARKDTESDTV